MSALEDRAVPATLAVVNQLDSGPGSLRQAILDSNSIAGPDTIVFAKSVRGITLTSGELAITDSVKIVGPGERKLTISGNHASRVFEVTAGTVNISGLTIANGRAGVNAATIPGAGGGILNQGNLTLDHVTVRGNEAVGDASTARYYGPYFLVGAALGGGVANLGTMTVTNSQINGNQAFGGDGSVGPDFPNVVYPGVALGGGIYNLLGNVTIDDSDLRGNSVEGGSNCQGSFASNGFGGAVYNDASLTITDSLLSYNLALGGSGSVGDLHVGHGVGGAIASGSVAALFGGGSAHLTVSKSELEFNQARGGDNNTLTLPSALVSPADTPSNGFGGAICVFQGTGAIDRSEFEHNQARGGANGADRNGSLGVGGGAFFFAFIGPVNGLVEKSSFEHNSAVGGYGTNGTGGGNGLGGGLAVGNLGAAFGGAGTLTVTHSAIEHNLAQGGSTVTCSVATAGGDAHGGGIYGSADSTITVTDSQINHNRARGGQGRQDGSNGNGIGGSLDGLGVVSVDNATQIAHNQPSAIPFYVTGGGLAPQGVPLSPGPTAPHDATGTMTLLGTYAGSEGSFELLSIDFATLSGTFRGSFVFIGPNGDRAYFTYGADPANPGKFTLAPTADGFVITFDAIFKPVASLSTGRFAKATGGSFRMIATSDPVVPDPNNPGFTTPFHYTWTGEGFLEFGQ